MTRTTAQALRQQKEDAEREFAQKKTAAAVKRAASTSPAPPASTTVAPVAKTAVAVPDTRTSVQSYLDEVAPSSIVGRMIRFDGKAGVFITPDDEGEIKDDIDFIALCDMTLIGWIKFNEDAPPDRRLGMLYDGFRLPPRDSLGDLDPNDWPAGLSGEPEDVWKHQIYLVLQQAGTTELFTFVTSSKTGRRAVGNLLRHFDRMQKLNAGEYPVVKLKAGGFQHKDERIGWVPTPTFAVVGRAPRDAVAKPDTSLGGDMDDQIPF
jgi:hypothetical protein